jgi:PAS domain S-box-containing protein
MNSPHTPATLEKELECPETAVVTASLDGIILAWNAGAEKVWGYSSREVLGKHISLLEAPRSRTVGPLLEKVARAGGAVKTQWASGMDKSGHAREVAVSAVPVFNASGEVEAVNATVTDLARYRRKQAFSRKLVDLFQHTQVGICVGNPVTRTLDLVNPAYARMHGCTVEDLIGRPISDVFPPDRHGDLAACFKSAQESGRHSFETEHIRSDGSRFPVLIDVTCVRGSDGTILHFVADVHDISRTVWAERRVQQVEELRRRDGEFVEMIRQMRAGVLIVDAESRKLLLANDEAERLFGPEVRAGAPLDHLRGRLPITRADGRAYREPGDWPLERSLRGEVINDEEIRLASEGGPRALLVSSAPVRDAAGRIERAVATIHDITDRKRQAEEVRALSGRLEQRVRERTADLSRKAEELEAFAYTVAHDLRAPLRGIYGVIDLLLQETEPTPAARDYALRIQTAAGRMNDLITDLLAYARFTYQEVQVTRVSLRRAVDRALDPWRHRLVQGELEVLPSDMLPDVLGEESILVQAITQLIDNAAKFVRPGERPRIRLYTETQAGRVRLIVEDQGIGLAPGDADRIFGIFQRLHHLEEYPGTGIGLAIVQKSIERLGGRVGVESDLGKGSRFWIELAKAGEESPPSPATPSTLGG